MRVFALIAVLGPLVGCAGQITSPGTGDTMGSAYTGFPEEVAPDGHWAFLCEARKDTDHDGKIEVYFEEGESTGDQLVPYFVERVGEGERVDELLATDREGRFVALRIDNSLVLVDTLTQQRTKLARLGARAVREQVSIDARGLRLVYPNGEAAVIRDLATGNERNVPLGEGWAGELASGGDSLVALVRREGANRFDGVFSSEIKFFAGTCNESVPSHDVLIDSGARGLRKDLVPMIVDTRTGVVRAGDGLIYANAGGLVRRVASAIELERGDTQTTLVPASCDARVRFFDLEREVVVSECRSTSKAEGGTTSVQVFAHGKALPVALTDWASDQDRFEREQRRLFVGTDGQGIDIYDDVTGRVVRRPESAIMTDDANVLLDRESDHELLVLHVDKSDQPIDLGIQIVPNKSFVAPDWVKSGSLVAVEGHLVDLAKAKVLGTYVGKAVAVGRDGRVLTHDGLLSGKAVLTWQRVSR